LAKTVATAPLIHESALVLQSSLDTTATIFNAQTTLLPAANSHLGGTLTPSVQPGDTSLELIDDTAALVQILGEDTSSETKFGSVGALDGLLKNWPAGLWAQMAFRQRRVARSVSIPWWIYERTFS
jgi:hypothetical protein